MLLIPEVLAFILCPSERSGKRTKTNLDVRLICMQSVESSLIDIGLPINNWHKL